VRRTSSARWSTLAQEARGGTVLQLRSARLQYAANDRPLNVVILSDGLTEPQERRVLLQQIQSRRATHVSFALAWATMSIVHPGATG